MNLFVWEDIESTTTLSIEHEDSSHVLFYIFVGSMKTTCLINVTNVQSIVCSFLIFNVKLICFLIFVYFCSLKRQLKALLPSITYDSWNFCESVYGRTKSIVKAIISFRN